jgi:protein subunit release factor A
MDAKLEEIEARYESVGQEMASPEGTGDHERLRDIGRSYAELGEIVGPIR